MDTTLRQDPANEFPEQGEDNSDYATQNCSEHHVAGSPKPLGRNRLGVLVHLFPFRWLGLRSGLTCLRSRNLVRGTDGVCTDGAVSSGLFVFHAGDLHLAQRFGGIDSGSQRCLQRSQMQIWAD